MAAPLLPLDEPPAAPVRAADGAAGHRARLRQRLLTGGPDALADYEIVEFLLFGANPRGDTKPLAKDLLRRFGSLAGVLDADPILLRQVKGMGEGAIGALRIAAVAARRMAQGQARARPVLANWQALIDYLSIDMAHLTTERVRVLYLDSRNGLIDDHNFGNGTVDGAAVYAREVVLKGANIGAAALILVHNHPSGNPEPSRADIELTHQIADVAHAMGITLHDHVIVGRGQHVSLRARGLLAR
ncbi:DNA repair protein RadC [Croceibacterium sp. TMG7-5b_MA50]|uniref:RadC family protein n=1 Tax=Croceibacterium sp. TMG7-5b_MA50 TaxID=3121290 RepID=UPI0032219CE7